MYKTILLLLALLACTASPSYAPYLTEDKLKDTFKLVVQNSFAKGQNDRDFPLLLANNEAALIQNAVIEDIGILKKRKGLTLVGNDISDSPVLGVGTYNHSTVGSRMIVASNGSIYRLNGASFTNIATGLSTTLDIEFVTANDLCFIMNGTDRIRYYNSSAETVTTFGSSGTDPPLSKIGIWVKDRLFLVNESNPSRIRYSSIGDPLTYPVTNDLPVNEKDGQRINALMPYRNDLLIFKERSIWVLEMEGADPLTNWNLSVADYNVGTLSPRSVKQLWGDIIFLDQSGKVRTVLRTQLDALQPGAKPISDTVKGTLDNLNYQYIGKVACVVWGDNYLLSLPYTTSAFNNRVLVWNIRTQSWAIYTGWQVACWSKFVISNVEYLIGGEASSNGIFYQCYIGTSDNGVAIDLDVQTREYDLDSFADKEWTLLDLSCQVTSGSLTIQGQFDRNGWASVGTLSLAGDAPLLPQTLPFTLGNEDQARGKYHLEDNGRSRTAQFRFRNNEIDTDVTIRNFALFGRLLPYMAE